MLHRIFVGSKLWPPGLSLQFLRGFHSFKQNAGGVGGGGPKIPFLTQHQIFFKFRKFWYWDLSFFRKKVLIDFYYVILPHTPLKYDHFNIFDDMWNVCKFQGLLGHANRFDKNPVQIVTKDKNVGLIFFPNRNII